MSHITPIEPATADIIAMKPGATSNLPSPDVITLDVTAEPVEAFLTTAKRVLGAGVSAQTVNVSRNSDLDLSSGRGEITVRARLPNGLELEAKRTLQRHSLRWRRLWPYLAAVLVIASAVIVAWNGTELLAALNRILVEILR